MNNKDKAIHKELTLSYKKLTLSALLLVGVTNPAVSAQLNDSIQNNVSSQLSDRQHGIQTNKFNSNLLIYTTDEMSSFNVTQYLRKNAPHLEDYADIISHWSGYSSISPRILIALIEYKTGIISDASRLASSLDQPMGQLSQQTGFSKQIQSVALSLANNYYQNINSHQQLSTKNSLNPMALLPLVTLLATNDSQTIDDKTNSIAPVNSSNHQLDEFVQTYFQLLPEQQAIKHSLSHSTSETELASKLHSPPPTNFLQLPFPIGEYWWTNKNHRKGSQPNPSTYFNTALFFNNGKDLVSTSTANKKVVAAAPGKVIQHSDCAVEIVHDKGWSTVYYNLTDIKVSPGQTVDRNQPLANYSTTDQPSLCQSDTLAKYQQQFRLKQSGRYVSLNGVQLSGYTIHINQHEASSKANCNNFWLIRDETKYCAGRIYNHGIDEYDNNLPTSEPSLPPPVSGELPLNTPQSSNFFTPSLFPGFPGLPGLPDIIPMSKLACQIARAICGAIPGGGTNEPHTSYQTRSLPGLMIQEQQPQPQGAMPDIQDICPIIDTVCGIVDTLPGR